MMYKYILLSAHLLAAGAHRPPPGGCLRRPGGVQTAAAGRRHRQHPGPGAYYNVQLSSTITNVVGMDAAMTTIMQWEGHFS